MMGYEGVDVVVEYADMAGTRAGEFVVRQRAARGWTQAELAHRAGVGITNISQLEQGLRKRPSKETLRRLGEAFGMTYAQMLVGIGELTPEDLGGGAGPRLPDSVQRLLALAPSLDEDDLETLNVLASSMAKRKRSPSD